MKTPEQVRPSMDEFMTAERDRLSTERETLLTQRNTLDEEIAGVDRQINAIAAYHNALTPPASNQRSRTPNANSGHRQGGPTRKDAILAVLKDSPIGLTAAEIRTKLNATEAEYGSISTTLSRLTSNGDITRDEGDGRYSLKTVTPAPDQQQSLLPDAAQ